MAIPKIRRAWPALTYAGFLLIFFFASPSLYAQTPSAGDTVIEDVSITTTEPDESDPPGPPETSPFLPKASQLSGGGPDSLRIRHLSAAQLDKLKNDDAFWYANYVFEKKQQKERSSSRSITDTPVFQNTLWIVIIGVFIAVLVIYLSNSNVRLFRKNKTIAAQETDSETEDIFAINYRREIDKAAGAGNYRLAVRLQFLQLLRTLSDKHIIDYQQDRTNLDYLVQMNKTQWYTEFFRLTRSYEYSWYGQFGLDPDKYAVIKNEFESFDRKLS